MPTYIRPARVDITQGRGTGSLVLIAAVAAAAVVVGFIAAHLELLAAAAAAFLAIMGGILAAMRWAASPARLRRQLHPQHTAEVLPSRPARAIPASRPRAIEAPRTVADRSHEVNPARIPRVR